MTWNATPVQKATAPAHTGAASSISQALTGVTAGNAIIAAATQGGNTTCTFSSSGDTWTTLGTFYDSGAGQLISIGVAFNVTGGSKTVTATFGASTNFQGLIVAEVTGGGAGSLDVATAGTHSTSSSTTVTDSSMTTTTDGDLIVSCCILDSGAGTVTAGSGFTLVATDGNFMSLELGVQTTHGAIAPTFTLGTSQGWAVVSAALKAAAAGGGAQTVTPSGIASAEAFGSATVGRGPVSVAPSGIASAEAFGSATVSSLAHVAPTGIASLEAFGSDTITVGPVTVSPSGIGSGEAFGSPTVTGGSTTVSPTGIASAESFGTATVSPGPVSVAPTGIGSGEAFGSATVSGTTPGQSILPTGIPSGEAVGTPQLGVGATNVAPVGIDTGEAFGTPSLSYPQGLSPTGIASAEVFGVPEVGDFSTWLYTPPQYDNTERLAGHGLHGLYYSFPVSKTVWKDAGGTWHVGVTPGWDLVVDAQLLFNRPTVVSDTTAQELIATGIGTCERIS